MPQCSGRVKYYNAVVLVLLFAHFMKLSDLQYVGYLRQTFDKKKLKIHCTGVYYW